MALQNCISYCSKNQSASHVDHCLFCLCLCFCFSYHACVISAFGFGRVLFTVPVHLNMVRTVLVAVLQTINKTAANNNCHNDPCSQFYSWLLMSLKSIVGRSWCSWVSPVTLHDTFGSSFQAVRYSQERLFDCSLSGGFWRRSFLT